MASAAPINRRSMRSACLSCARKEEEWIWNGWMDRKEWSKI